MLNLIEVGIKEAHEKGFSYKTRDYTTDNPIVAGQVLVMDTGGKVKPADATTDSTSRILLATEPWDPATDDNHLSGDKIELVYTSHEHNTSFVQVLDPRIAGTQVFTHADIGTRIGLSADGLTIDKTNTTELLEITKVVGSSYSDKSVRVFFNFLNQ